MDVINYVKYTGDVKTLIKISILGHGAFGQVYKYLLDGYGNVACKEQSLSKNTIKTLIIEANISHFLTEYSTPLLKIIVNPSYKKYFDSVNVKFIGFCETMPLDRVYTMYDLIDGVELADLVKLNKDHGTHFDIKILFRYFKDLLTGLRDMIKKEISHRDIKPGNIMLDKGRIKYIDFGFACMYSDCSSKPKGTPNYMSPEVFRRTIDDWSKVDIFALGIVFFFLLTTTTIWSRHSFKKLQQIENHCMVNDYEQIQNIFYSIIVNTIPEMYIVFVPLISGMTQADPQKRINIDDAMDLLSRIQLTYML